MPGGPDLAGAAILARAGDVFARRLDPGSAAPLAVGFSGGGDSLALLLAARTWARANGRPLLALTVDHGLNSQSAAWTARAARTARSLGAGFRALSWTAAKPRTGVPAAARRARHSLLADAARAAGASVVLLGHTEDDVREAGWMRAHGSSVGAPREWAPSPAWPEGRGVFLLRPLLRLGRAELRALLAGSGLGWLEDPANDDPRSLRSVARRSADGPAVAVAIASGPRVGDFEVDASGTVRLGRAADRRLLAMACVCAGGGERLPRGDGLDRLTARLASGQAFVATLAGARIAAGESLTICRDPGRLTSSEAPLPPGEPVVFDGRFEITGRQAGLVVRPLGGLVSRLEKPGRSGLGAFAPWARRSLPALVKPDGTVTCPILAQGAWGSARALVGDRLEAACGRIARESPLATPLHGEGDTGALS